ncbi:MAG: hypothetical protein N2Z69_02140 [Methylophilaceae bacterium]|nr:hypothetical protein [Methylophilaceae bacterium]
MQLIIGALLLLVLILTRGSHAGTAYTLPDATLAVMMLGGLLFRRGLLFALALAVCVAVDAFAVGIAGVSSYCLSPAYWALLPTYAVMWYGGVWLAERGAGFRFAPYMTVAFLTTSLAFVLSTHSFYLFSGRFPKAPLWEVLQHGWEYYPAYLGYTLMYLAGAWAARLAVRTLADARRSRHV